MATYNGYLKPKFDWQIGDIIQFSQVANVANMDYTTPCPVLFIPGRYFFELWGSPATNAPSAYTNSNKVQGYLNIPYPLKLFFMVGNAVTHANGVKARLFSGEEVILQHTLNGGGAQTRANYEASGTPRYASVGGGATDLRLEGGNWYDLESLKSRIMVAGGTGSMYRATSSSTATQGGYGNLPKGGGTLAGTQTTGYGVPATALYPGQFGFAGVTDTTLADSTYRIGGGGGGYYGAGSLSAKSNVSTTGGGGSGFISGHPSCNAIDRDGNHTGQPIHYSGLAFDGYSTTTAARPNSTVVAGFARATCISLLEDAPKNYYLVEDFGILKTWRGGDWVAIPQ